jgi:DNA-binding NtrC family response regulator
MAYIAKDMGTPELSKPYPTHINDEKIKRVFIIEDNEMHSMMMDYLLSKENNFNIFRFSTGEECISKLNLRPDIIILDYSLPGINGMETFTQIKAIEPEIPIIVITENRNAKIAQQFKDKGAYKYIVKDTNSFHQLNSVVESILIHLSEKENAASNHTSIIVLGGFILLVIISGIISYLLMKH